MSHDDTQRDLQGKTPSDDEIEILEVVGMNEDGEPIDVPEDSGGGPATAADEDACWAGSADRDDEPREVEVVDDADPGALADRDRLAPGRPERGDWRGTDVLDPQGQLLQIRADYENLRKRVEKERREYEEHANSTLVARLLPVLDNFERALAVAVDDDGDSSFREGVLLIYRHFRDELRREGLRAIEAEGEPFDPNVHDAVATEARPAEGAEQLVVEELQRGYLFRSRLLRPAQVKVAVAGAPAAGTGGGARGEDD